MLQLDSNFFRPFVESTVRTLSVQCNVNATHKKPFIKGSQPQPQFEIAGVIGLTSTLFSGNITLCFTSQLYLTLMNNMLGENFTEITPDLHDGAAELLNIIFGNAKKILNQHGHSIQRAIPTVIRGADLKTSHIASGTVLVLPFDTPSGEFQIEISAETPTTC